MRVATLAVALLSVVACSSDAGPEVPPISTATLVMPETPPAPGALVRVLVRGGALTATPAPTLGGVAIAASRADDTTLVFALPATAPGVRPLALLLADGSKASAPLTVAAAVPVGEPAAFINASLDAAVALLDGLAAGGVDSADLAAARQQLATSRTQIAGLTDSERTQLAQFLASNAALFPQTVGNSLAMLSTEEECVSATADPASADLEQCAERVASITLAEAERVTTFYSYVVLAAGSAILPGGGILTPIAVGLFGGLALAELRDGVAATLDRAQLPFPFAGELVEVLGEEPGSVRSGARRAAMVAASTGSSVFLAGAARQVRFTMRYTSPTAADSPRSPLLASMLTAYGAMATAWSKIRTLLPFFPEFPAFPVTPRQSITKAPPVRTLRLGAVAPATITGTFASTGDDAVTLSFDSPTLSDDTPFTFELIYGWNGLAEQKITVSAVFRPVAVARMTIAPDVASLRVGDTVTFVARGYDAADNLLAGRTATFSADQPQTLQVNAQTGFSTALVRGATVVTATMGAARAQGVVDVEEAAVATIAIDQATPGVDVGGTLQLSATLRDVANNILSTKTVTWSSATPSVATVSSSTGLVTGVAQGTSVVTASSEGRTAQVTVTVTLPAFVGWARLADHGTSNAMCAFANDGTSYCWGSNPDGAAGNLTSGNSLLVPTRTYITPDFATIAQGSSHACGLTPDGLAYCWGLNDLGQLGNGTQSSSLTAVPVGLGITFRSIEAGGSRTCGVSAANSVYCWGWNPMSTLSGSGHPEYFSTPSLVPDQAFGGTVAELAVNRDFACARLESGGVYCWGKLGTAYHNAPSLISSTQTFTQLSGGSNHVCGVDSTGAAWCWGDNFRGQLGTGVTGAGLYTPQQVTGATVFTSVHAGSGRTCGLSDAGAALCWGENFGGTLGRGFDVGNGNFPTPAPVTGGRVFTEISAGSQATCGRTADGRIYCWGVSRWTGTGSETFDRPVPTEIVNP